MGRRRNDNNMNNNNCQLKLFNRSFNQCLKENLSLQSLRSQLHCINNGLVNVNISLKEDLLKNTMNRLSLLLLPLNPLIEIQFNLNEKKKHFM